MLVFFSQAFPFLPAQKWLLPALPLLVLLPGSRAGDDTFPRSVGEISKITQDENFLC